MRVRPATLSILTVLLSLSLTANAYRLYALARHFANQKPEGDASTDVPLSVLVSAPTIYTLYWTPWWSFWTVITTCFIELEWLPLLCNIAVIWVGGQYCEKIWSKNRYAVFVLGILLTTTVAEIVVFYLLTALDSDAGPVPIRGAGSAAMGILVGLKQLIPEHMVVMFGGKVRIRVKWLAALYLTAVSCLSLAGLYTQVTSYWLGFVSSWVFLRFIQTAPEPHNSASRLRFNAKRIRGDASDSFAFSQLFPEPISFAVEKLTGPLARAAQRLGVVPKFSSADIETANSRYAARISGNVLPMYDQAARSTNERRKQMLKNLPNT